MKHLIVTEIDVLVLFTGNLVCVCVIDVIDLSLLIPVCLYVLRKKRIQRDNIVPTIPDDLCIGISPQKKMCHHRLPEGEARHFRIGLTVQQFIQRMIHSTFLRIVLFFHPIKMQWKARHCLRQKTYAGIHCRDLHCALFIYSLAGICSTEYECLTGVADVIRHLRKSRRIPGADPQPFKKPHPILPPGIKKGPPDSAGWPSQFSMILVYSIFKG